MFHGIFGIYKITNSYFSMRRGIRFRCQGISFFLQPINAGICSRLRGAVAQDELKRRKVGRLKPAPPLFFHHLYTDFAHLDSFSFSLESLIPAAAVE